MGEGRNRGGVESCQLQARARWTATAVASWRRFLDTVRTEGRSGCELANLLTLAALVTNAAERRTESRGTHWRSDYPQVDD
ncbi:MAG: L-aspartate oxidase, partial [SAR324 cluster bacterium]|nr:L-aspartate oxidase [SAR324 cluster bacterium]